ncbi:Acetyltransferase (GNAT) family protein [Candidatus Izimaplasma bacterium HR1]|jgi:ribosomal protein S18 acetylase RimI-like enzyme|uniref:GNAT family N-acetyltransferase n=1 Tax=Candidatus Izimoplasma sp. HR1 TaxID=1541959 RepID=UPI0004F5CF15|nr:Acetyltransferase (GNAT) family protein [Candidatus Izimaplasma bacterium HR1]
MSNIVYQDLVFDEDAILNLYLNNEWYAYTNKKEQLFSGIKNSLDVIAAYDKSLLVGLIRTIGDANTIVYIQDILVLKEYQRQGIGRTFMKMIIEKYPNVRQVCLMTDESERSRKFYESLGLEDYSKQNTVGYIVKK